MRIMTVRSRVSPFLLAVLLMLTASASPVSATGNRARKLHVTKECSEYTGLAGTWCTVTASNLKRLPVGTKVFYTQPQDVPEGLLDSNVVLDAGGGTRAIGRCTLDLATGLGLCTFSDGTGELAGFKARVKVTCGDPIFCDWDGPYTFDRDFD
jgi:hypothetical protein